MSPEVLTGIMTAVSILVASWGIMFDQGIKQSYKKDKHY